MSVGTFSRRGVGLLVAVLLAAFATATWLGYVRSIERKAVRGNANVGVLVAKQSIPAGTSAEFAAANGLFETAAVPRRVLAEGAVGSVTSLKGRVASTTIIKGEQIVAARFVSPEQAGRLLNIPADKQAMAVQVDAPPGVGGFIQPRDRVSIIAKVDNQQQGAEVRFLMQDVEVLAVGQKTTVTQAAAAGQRDQVRKDQQADASTTQQDSFILTLALNPLQAEQLAFAVLEGDVYFTLLPPGAKTSTTPGRTAETLYR